MSDGPLVIQTEELDHMAQDFLRQRCDFRVVRWDSPDFPELLPAAEGLVVRTYTRVDGALLDRAPNLRVVGRAGVALDNFDLAACRSRGVQVVHTPEANTSAVVELVTAFMLDAFRPRVFLDKPLEYEAWKALRAELRAERQLGQMTLGVLGMGRIGSGVARVGAALGMRVVYNDLLEIPEGRRFGAVPVPAENLFGMSDVVSLHIDPRPANRLFVAENLLSRMPTGALLINTSRGLVADPVAVANWLSADPTAQAIIDVHEPEPVTADDPLLGLPNAHLSPHIGAATRLAHENMSWVVRDVWRVLSGEAPEHPAPTDVLTGAASG
jgi:phosphoglycerate dehydrogenase-like enzyme